MTSLIIRKGIQLNKQDFVYFLASLCEWSMQSQKTALDYLYELFAGLKTFTLKTEMNWQDISDFLYYPLMQKKDIYSEKNDFLNINNNIDFPTNFRCFFSENNDNYGIYYVPTLEMFDENSDQWISLSNDIEYNHFSDMNSAKKWLIQFVDFIQFRIKIEGLNALIQKIDFENKSWDFFLNDLTSEEIFAGKQKYFLQYLEFLIKHYKYTEKYEFTNMPVGKFIKTITSWFISMYYPEPAMYRKDAEPSLSFFYILLSSFKYYYHNSHYEYGLEPWMDLIRIDKFNIYYTNDLNEDSIVSFEKNNKITLPNELKEAYINNKIFFLSENYAKKNLILSDSLKKMEIEIRLGPFYALYYLQKNTYPLDELEEFNYKEYSNFDEDKKKFLYKYHTGWSPRKREFYLTIGESNYGFILIGIKSENFGQIFLWVRGVSEEYNPQIICQSFSELIASSYQKPKELHSN